MNLSNITSNVSMPNIEPDREIHSARTSTAALTPADYYAIWENGKAKQYLVLTNNGASPWNA